MKDVTYGPLRSLLLYTPALPKQALAACANSNGLERPHLTLQYFTELQSERIPFGRIASKRRWSYLPFLMKRLHCAQFVARCKEDILKAKGVKPTLSPNLNTLATIEALDVKRLLFIGVGCQVLFCAILLKAHVLQIFDQSFYRHACLRVEFLSLRAQLPSGSIKTPIAMHLTFQSCHVELCEPN